MKKLVLATFLLTVGCASQNWRAPIVDSVSTENSKVFEVNKITFGRDLNVQKFKLTNGLQVIVLEDHSAPVFAYHTWFNVGSRNEREGITGIAHLFEHLMFKESKNLKEGEFDKVLEEQGGKVNAATFVDWTFYRESVPSEAFPLIPKMEADRLQYMILNDKQVNSEREVVANERRFRTDNSPSGLMYELLYKTAFTKHPYYWPVVGWMRDIQAITTKDCIDFHSTYYSPNNATVVVVGDVTAQMALQLINKAYGNIPPSKIPPENIPPEPEQKGERKAEVEQPIPSEKILIGYKTPNALNTDFAVLQVLHTLLFDGKSSRLYRKLVTDSQIATEVGGWVNQNKDPGLYIMEITTRPQRKGSEAQKLVEEEIQKLKTTLVPAEELEKVKNRLETSFWGNFRNADDKAQAIGFYETVTHDYRNLFKEVENYQKVTAADIQRAAQTYLVPERRTIVVAKPTHTPKAHG